MSEQIKNDIEQLLKESIPCRVIKNEEHFLIEVKDSNKELRQIKLEYDYAIKLMTNVLSNKSDEETVLLQDKSYEVPFKAEGRRFLSMRMLVRDGNSVKEDRENGFNYVLAEASDEYILFILLKVHEKGLIKEILKFGGRLRRMSEENEAVMYESVFNYLRHCMFPLYTVKIISEKSIGRNDFEKLGNAYIFNLGYNLDIALIKIRYLDDFTRLGRILRTRRIKFNDLEAPRRTYTEDLIYHYQLAIAAESPMLQYLSFYHVIEHFFDDIFNDDLIGNLKDQITHPGFSYKRKEDLNKLLKIVKKKLSFKGEGFVYNEQEALYLTLKRYVSLDKANSDLSNYDESLIEYYKDNEVSFSKGDRVDLSLSVEKVYSSLSNRIYKTRNAIVHSKETNKPKFLPYKHDKVLHNEIPLMRFIAEAIILETSDII